jgi:hypothetical protein
VTEWFGEVPQVAELSIPDLYWEKTGLACTPTLIGPFAMAALSCGTELGVAWLMLSTLTFP